MQSRIDIRGGIISDLKQIDTNSQKIDSNSTEIARVFREQIADDKLVRAGLESKLASCQGGQKWIALGSSIAGGFIGYKIRGAGTFQNPFVANAGANLAQSDYYRFNFQQTSAEQRLREALKSLRR